MLGAHTFTRSSSSATTWCGAEPIYPAVPRTRTTFLSCVGAAVADTALVIFAVPHTKAAFLDCVGAAVADIALAVCAMFTAHASRCCVGAATADTALAECTMFTAHAPRHCVGGAAIN